MPDIGRFHFIKTSTKRGETRGVSHYGLAILHFKSILRQKNNYGNSKFSPCKNTMFKKSSKRTKIFQDIITLITNLKFQYKPKYHLSKILI
jgi:hypothetical protein